MDEAVEWLREQVQARMATAKAASPGPWHASREPDEAVVYTTHYDPKGRQGYVTSATKREDAPFIAANDPQDVIARCEAELGILNLYRLWAAEDLNGNPALGAAACAVSDAVRHVASAYKYRDGYAEHWT